MTDMDFSKLTYIFNWKLQQKRIAEKKNTLRQSISLMRRKLTANDVRMYSEQILKRIEGMQAFLSAHTVLVYYPIHNEVDMRLLIDKWNGKKQFLLPVIHGHGIEIRYYRGQDNLVRGKYGIPEPDSEIFKGIPDLIIVPGVAFDEQQNRMGRGKGYYDRFLKEYKTETLGVCYDFQLIDHLPTTRFDKKVNRVFTPTRSIGM